MDEEFETEIFEEEHPQEEMRKSEYFALEEDTDKLLDILKQKIDDFYDYTFYHNFQYLWLGCAETYYMSADTGGMIGLHGPKGQYATLSTNRFRTNVNRQITMATKNEIEYKPVAKNTDSKTQFQADVLGKSLLNHYMKDKGANKLSKRSTEFDALFGEGWIHIDFDKDLGRFPVTDQVMASDEMGQPIIDETGQPQVVEQIQQDEVGRAIFEGDITYSVHSPNNVIRNPFVENADDCKWYILRRRVDKYELAEKYYGVTSEEGKDVYQIILDSSLTYNQNDYLSRLFIHEQFQERADVIYEYTFYHKPTPYLPYGRKLCFILNQDCILYDEELMNNNIPLIREAQYDRIGTPFGWSPAFDMLQIQEQMDDTYSNIITNQRAFGQHNIIRTEGTTRFDNISEGLNEYIVPSMDDAPKILDLLKTPAELFETVDRLNSEMDILAGLSEISHGQPQSAQLSGRAMFLLETRAIEANSPLQGARIRAEEARASMTIEILFNNIQAPRLIPIVGESDENEMIELKKEDLELIDKVRVEAVNPISGTFSGRMEMAEFMLQLMNVTGQPMFTGEQFLTFFSTGNLNTGTESKVKEIRKIKKIKEMIGNIEMTPEVQQGMQQLDMQHQQLVQQAAMSGQGVAPPYPYNQFYTMLELKAPVLMTDNHVLHIKELASLISGNETPADTIVVATRIIQHHIDILKDVNNAPVLQMLGQPVLAAPQQPPMGGPNQPKEGPEMKARPDMQRFADAEPRSSDSGMPEDMMSGKNPGNLDDYKVQ